MWINWPDYVRVLLEDCTSCLLSRPTCVMYYIGYLSLSGYNIVLLQWSPGVSFAVPPLTFVTSAAQCRSRTQHRLAVRRVLSSAASCELLVPRANLAIVQRRAFLVVSPSAWNDLPVELRSSPFQTHPSKFYISLKSLAVTGLGAPRSSRMNE